MRATLLTLGLQPIGLHTDQLMTRLQTKLEKGPERARPGLRPEWPQQGVRAAVGRNVFTPHRLSVRR